MWFLFLWLCVKYEAAAVIHALYLCVYLPLHRAAGRQAAGVLLLPPDWLQSIPLLAVFQQHKRLGLIFIHSFVTNPFVAPHTCGSDPLHKTDEISLTNFIHFHPTAEKSILSTELRTPPVPTLHTHTPTYPSLRVLRDFYTRQSPSEGASEPKPGEQNQLRRLRTLFGC